MTTFLPICVVWITTCVGLLSAEHVSGKESSTVVLPCTLRVVGGTPYIRWSTDKDDVFERKGKDSFQGEGYGGRVNVPEAQLLKGDCSLELKNLTLADSGVYQSYQAVRRTKRSSRVSDKWDLISSVTVDVTPVSSKETNQKLVERSFPTGDARMNRPHPQIMVLSLLSCFVFQLFYKETPQSEMAKLLSLFSLQLLFGFFCQSLFEISSIGHVSVHPGENITLLCNITNYSEISWYRLRSEEVKLLISAKQGNLDKTYLLSYNVNESHFDITESSSSVSLVIIGVRETDLGFYFCGGRNNATHIQFGKLIRLNFTETHENNSPKPPDNRQSIGEQLWMTVCLVSVLINLIMCVFCCRPKGKSVSSCSCCSNTTDAKKEENIHYASIQYKRRSRAAAKKNAGSDSDRVTYATVASQPRRH